MKTNPHFPPMWELRYTINKFNYELIGRYFSVTLAFGMRKKFNQEDPKNYPLHRMVVKKVQ